ncbi:MAG: methyltransferase [Phycisphaera sp.]|nr:methyltransferase [Phycisphaera sp.]
MLKILGGQYRSRILESPPDSDVTRPITARVKESVFNLLRGWFDDASVLDLFAGVGTIGLEAVSRGATDVVMIEQDRRTAAILRFNVDELGCGESATVVQADAFGPAALAQAPRDCDVVFLDPPYPLWRDEATRGRIIELAVRCRTVMKEKSFLVLRIPEEFSSEDGGLAGFDGPETHRYAEDMYVHLFMPTPAEEDG